MKPSVSKAPATSRPRSRPRVVYTQPPIVLGTVLGRAAGGWRLRLGAVERTVSADPSLDEALLDEAAQSGARVVVDTAAKPVIVGLLVTERHLRISREGNVNARVNDFRLTSAREVLLRTSGAYVQLKASEVELFANRVVTRARELAKILGRMVKLN